MWKKPTCKTKVETVVYQSVRQITEKKESRVSAIKDKNGVAITDPARINDRWREHFAELYNVKDTADANILEELPSSTSNSNVDVTPKLEKEEIEAAIKRMKLGKAPGVDKVTVDEMRAAGNIGMDMLFKLFERVWEREEIPKDWSRAVIVPIFKKKDKTVCDNYRGISLLCHAEKVFASVILQRIRKRTDEILTESQAGFRKDRSTIDQLFSLRLLTEKYTEFSKSLYICYVDYQKAFDSVWREGLWHIMSHLGYEKKIIRLLQALYKETFSAVRVDGELTDWFQTVIGVLQGCVLSPMLFCIFLEVVMARALEMEETGVVVSGTRFNNLKFADDIALIADEPAGLQSLIDSTEVESKQFGLTVSTAKTEVQCIPPEDHPMLSSIRGVTLKQSTDFVYLGGKISDSADSSADIARRIGLATGVGRSLAAIWKSKDIGVATKIRLYNTPVLPVLLYNAETWTMKEELNRKLLVFEMTVLRCIAGVTRRDRHRNTDIRLELGVTRDVVNHIRAKRLSYFGHVARMQSSRIPNIMMYMAGFRGEDLLEDQRKGGLTT